MIYSNGLDKGFGSIICVGTRVWHETYEEDQKIHLPKYYEYNNEDGDNSSNPPSDKDYQASSQKFRHITWKEMQTASSRIWTLVTDSIAYKEIIVTLVTLPLQNKRFAKESLMKVREKYVLLIRSH